MTPIIEDNALVIGDYREDLPKLPRAAIVTAWAVPADYRASGYFAATRLPGQTEEVPACDLKAAQLIATLNLPPHPDAIRDSARAERLAMLNDDTERTMAALIADYPECEIKSWPQQVKEAEALAADPQAAAPLLAELAAARGIALAELSARVLQKAAGFSVASGRIIGTRQALEDALIAATTHDEVLAVPTLREALA